MMDLHKIRLRKELEILMVFYLKYDGVMKESLEKRIKLLNNMLNNQK